MTPKKSTTKSVAFKPADKSPIAAQTAQSVPPTAAQKAEDAARARKVASKPIAKKADKTAGKVKPVKVTKTQGKKPGIESPKPEAAKTKPAKAAKTKLSSEKAGLAKTATLLDSKVVYEGKLFRVLQDHLIEPGGRESYREVIRHNGSVVILAVDPGKDKKDPWIVIERQYRHAAGQFLWELPAGKLDAGETAVEGAKRELAEETGYQARKWTILVNYFASPGFLGESMNVFLAEGLVGGDAHPEEDEKIEFRLVKLSEVLAMIDKGKIIDGKTLTSVLLYARQLGIKRKK